MDERSFDALLAWGMYGVHMLSLPVWTSTSVWALWRQRNLKTQVGSGPQAAGVAALPTESEFYSLRLLAVYSFVDVCRAVDACFDSSDGVCRAVWGFTPLAFRLFCWCVRDVALLGAITLNLNYYLGWTFKALGWPPPRLQQRAMLGTLGASMVGIAGSFTAIVRTNRQSYQAVALVFVVALNAAWAMTNLTLLTRVVPALRTQFCLDDEHASDGKSESAGPKPRAPPRWLTAAVAEVQMTARLVLTANVAILVLFPALVAERLVLKGAHSLQLVPCVPLGSSAAFAPFPRVDEKPLGAGIALNPALEVVEIMIGWLQFVYVLRVGGCSPDARPPPAAAGATAARGYVGQEALGAAARLEGAPSPQDGAWQWKKGR